MRVVIIGGYGVFGGRLARLLLRDGHEVWIAGRDLTQAERFARAHGGTPIRLERMGDLSPILEAGAEAVVDAAGPYQAYRTDALKVPRFCAEHALCYLDLSDDAEFTASIATLDGKAREAGCAVLSGVSSVPALSSSVVASLTGDMDAIEAIDVAILPGNRAPRGRSLVANMLSQVGAPLRVWRGGAWHTVPCWSNAKTYSVGKDIRRRACVFGVPDLQLFPDYFGARSVLFRAGLELGVFSRALSALGWLRRAGLGRLVSACAPVAHSVAGWLERFGTDRGAMVVTVTGRRGPRMIERRWELVVEAGDGPFIPTVPARALLRNPSSLTPGARPCLAEIPVEAYLEAMSGLAVSTRVVEAPV